MLDPTFSLEDSDKNSLSRALDAVIYEKNGACSYVNALNKLAYKTLPGELLDIFLTQKASKSPLPYIYINNIPTDLQVSGVPLQGEDTASYKSGFRSENILIMLASLLGEPYSMAFEGEEIVNNLIPFLETATDYTGLGSSVELDFHIENAALKHFFPYNFSPMGLMLTGVNHDESGPMTRISDGNKALSLLSVVDREVLSSESYRIKVPHRWRGGKYSLQKTETDWVPISLSKNGRYSDISAVFYQDMIVSKNKDAERALGNFHNAVKEVSEAISIRPGQLLYIDNRIALHSRDQFKPTYQNGRPRRWVQRVFVSPNLWSHRDLQQVEHRIYEITA
ncbi:MAG: taurine catabolism dioxygenase TauD [unclassified Hahellaceae]|nr:taurine catabolism dioxygenase TauD [Hahellaceae bacterium]|tara:strand:+ start:81239 stop:82249 length:1011 start_codon:yes stop_codon:yes gene_type:complete